MNKTTPVCVRPSAGALPGWVRMPSKEGLPDSFQRTEHRHALRGGLLPSGLANFPVQMVAKQSPESDI